MVPSVMLHFVDNLWRLYASKCASLVHAVDLKHHKQLRVSHRTASEWLLTILVERRSAMASNMDWFCGFVCSLVRCSELTAVEHRKRKRCATAFIRSESIWQWIVDLTCFCCTNSLSGKESWHQIANLIIPT